MKIELLWIIPIAGAFATILAFYFSKPKRPILAILASIIIFVTAIWQSWEAVERYEAQQEVRKHIANKLSAGTRSFLAVISGLLVRSSDGWIPESEEQFFAPKTADYLCRELNMYHPAPISPSKSLGLYVADAATTFKKSIGEILRDYSDFMNAELVRAVSKVESSIFFDEVHYILQARRRNPSLDALHPPLLCWGAESLASDSLVNLRNLFNLVKEQEGDFNISRPNDWIEFPENYRKRFLGIDRFSPEALDTWKQAHPNSPGPMKIGSGNPNKKNSQNLTRPNE